MLNAQIKSDRLKDTIEVLSALVQETKLTLMPQGISTRAVDPANVAMVSIDLAKDAFDSFEATDGEIGVDITKLNGIMELANKDDVIRLELDEKGQKLVIGIRGLAYTISLLDPSTIRKEPKIPELNLPAHVTLRGDDLKRAVKAAEKVGDYMNIGVKGDIFFMEGDGDTDKVLMELKKDQLIDITPCDANSLFSLDYLSDISRTAGKASQVTLDVGKDYPMKVRFAFAEGHGQALYMLAPRVESS